MDTTCTRSIDHRPAPHESASRAAPLGGTLLLGDGTIIRGQGVGAEGITSGEVVFTTTMTGYQEALTDPSYRGQLLLFTTPLVGNYGIHAPFWQSSAIHARAVILSTLSPSWTTTPSLVSLLEAHAIPTLTGIDTRALARHLRTHGAMPAALALHPPAAPPDRATLEAALAASPYEEADLVDEVSVSEPVVYGEGGRRALALLDCGTKQALIRELVRRDARVIVLPAGTSAEEILALGAEGVVVSNGPGNPAMAQHVIETVRSLYGSIPLLGICLGHQILALAAGGRTYKLPFGHRGANQPVLDCETGRAFITTQNHGYAVDAASLPGELLVSYRNLNDGTVEGMRHRSLPIRSVQFHPEGAPGPQDVGVVLDEWLEAIAWAEAA